MAVTPGVAADADFDKRATIVDLYRQGWTFQKIGNKLDISKQRANQLYWDAMHAVIDPAVTAHRAAMVEEIAEGIRIANQIMHTDHYAHSNGRVVVNPDTGQPLVDDAPKLDAFRAIIAAHARLARLVGADAATKVEGEISVLRYEVVGVPVDKLV